MKKILITGGAGFIGSHLVEHLLREGSEVVVFDNFSSGTRENVARAVRNVGATSPGAPKVTVEEGDVRDSDALARCANGCDGIVHLAALVSVQESVVEPRLCFDINSAGTFNALEAARLGGVERFVFASSAAIYGDEAPVPVSEEAIPRPLTPYGATKAEGELLCVTYAASYGVTAVPLRFFNVFGEYQDPSGPYAAVISKFADCFQANESPRIFGDGEQTRDFVYVRDVVRAIAKALEIPKEHAGVPLNIGTGQTTSLLELVDAFSEAWDSELVPRLESARPGDILHSCAVVDRARRILGFSATTPVVDGLRAIRRTMGDDR